MSVGANTQRLLAERSRRSPGARAPRVAERAVERPAAPEGAHQGRTRCAQFAWIFNDIPCTLAAEA